MCFGINLALSTMGVAIIVGKGSSRGVVTESTTGCEKETGGSETGSNLIGSRTRLPPTIDLIA
jgi:hypothetical protein